MTRQDAARWLVWGVGVGLLAGCVSPQRSRPHIPDKVVVEEPTAEAPTSAAQRSVLPQNLALAAAGPGSAYHARPATPAAPAVAPATITSESAIQTTSVPIPAPDLEPASPVVPVGMKQTPSPADDPPLVAALRCLIEKRSGDAVAQLLVNYDKSTQELLLCLLPPLVRVGQGSLDQAKPQEVAHLVDQLESAAASLRSRAALSVERACYCRRLEGFGKYEPLGEDHPFRPGELAMLYVELEHFSCVKQGAAYEVQLAGSLEIRDQQGSVKWKQDFPAQADRSQTPRHDYFLSYRFYVPELKADMPPGQYKLRLKVVDVATQRSAERCLDLRVTTRPGQ